MQHGKYLAYVKLIFGTLLATIHGKIPTPLRKSWVRPCRLGKMCRQISSQLFRHFAMSSLC